MIPFGEALQRIQKARLLSTFGFFLFSICLQNQAFDAIENKKSQPKG
jgi:hypothetical protein